MTVIKDIDDTRFVPANLISAQDLYDLAIIDEAGLRLAINGDREGLMAPHNHTSKGGRQLTRSLLSVSLGPYARPGSLASPAAGVPAYPPIVGVDFGAVNGQSYKLLWHSGIYLPGGVETLRVRVGCAFGGAGNRTMTLFLALRPIQKMGLQYYGAGNWNVTAQMVLTTNGAANNINASAQLAPLSRLGDVNTPRWYELLIGNLDNPTAATTPRLLGVKVDSFLSGTLPAPNAVGLPPIQIDVQEVRKGAFLVERLTQRISAMFDGLIYATLGRLPGKLVSWAMGNTKEQEDKTSPYRLPIVTLDGGQGVHQHTGARYGDGALIPGQLATLTPIDDEADTAGNQSNKQPVSGAPIDPAGVGATPASLRTFQTRVSIARGDTQLIIRVCVRPKVQSLDGFLWMYVRTRMILASDYNAAVRSLNPADAFPTNISTDIITSIEQGQQTAEQAHTAGGYWQLQVQPEDCDLYTPNSARIAAGRTGHWTERAMLPTELAPIYTLPTYAPGQQGSYRASKPLTLHIDPQGRTGDVMVEIKLYLLDGAGAAQTAPTLQWGVVVRPEQT